MHADDYTRIVAERLRGDGASVAWEDSPSGSALVGYKSQFRWRWGAAKVNLFTVLSPVPSITASGLENFANEVLDLGVPRKGKFRGLQNGVAAIPALVSSNVEPEAISTAKNTLIRRPASFAWPVVVDLRAGHVYRHEGSVKIGGIFASWMRQQIAVALPKPTEN
jgi:hypothetical protein